MRPTIEEQIEGSCRLLEVVVAVEVADSHALEVLSELTRNLRMIGSSWTQLLPFLHWDNEATTGLLDAARPIVEVVLAQRIVAVIAGAQSDPFDFSAVSAHNDELRAVLSELVTELDPESGPQATEIYRDILRHFDLRARRYPMRMVPQLSASNSTKDS